MMSNAKTRKVTALDQDEMIEYKKQKIKTELQNRRFLEEQLLIPFEKRLTADQGTLNQILLTFPCFQMVAEDDYANFIELTKTLRMQKYDLDQHVFHQGDEPDNCYVIVFGSCQVKVSFTFVKMGSVRHKTKTMCKLETKSLFGELSMLFKGKRTASIITTDFCSLLVIPNAGFRKYMKTLLLRKLSVTVSFYRSLSFMENLPTNVILILASKTELQKFSKDTLICM